MDCDIAASRDGELIVLELKRRINLALILQATHRQKAADGVYVAVLRPKGGRRTSHWRRICHLLRRLELGLIIVTPSSGRVEVIFHPLPFERKRNRGRNSAILREMAGRSTDANTAGSRRRKIVTAYRESAIFIACCLDKLGPQSPKNLRSLGTGAKTHAILYSNYYGWFDRLDRGVYGLKAEGKLGLESYPELASHYRRLLASENG